MSRAGRVPERHPERFGGAQNRYLRIGSSLFASVGVHSRFHRIVPVRACTASILLAFLVVVGHLTPTCISRAAGPDDGFQSLFDGRTLDGWESHDPRYWTVEDGAITGRITPEQPCTLNQYLVWKGGELADFELKLKSRLNGQGGINNGFQFRSRVLPDHDVCGYQVDNNLQTDWLVRLYDEYGRHTLALRGEEAIFDAAGQRTASPLPTAQGPAWFQLEHWHEYHLVCRGSHLALHIDGRLAAQIQDHDPRRAETQGMLALQLHSGPPTVVQFKDIQLKVLKPATPRPTPPPPDRTQQSLRREAVAWWSLDTGGHGATPALTHTPGWDRFELNVRADGPGARPHTQVVVLDGAHFESEPTLPLGDGPMTLHVRARDPRGTWNATLLSKGTGPGSWKLHAVDLPETPGPDLVFEIAADGATGRVRVPVASIEPTAWHDVVARFDGQSLALFVDGQHRASTAWNLRPKPGPEPLLIAAQREGGQVVRHFRGDLESVALWSRALTDDEIRALSRAPGTP